MREILKDVKGLQIKKGDACLTCGARAWSVVTGEVVHTWHRRSAEVDQIEQHRGAVESSAQQGARGRGKRKQGAGGGGWGRLRGGTRGRVRKGTEGRALKTGRVGHWRWGAWGC